MKSKILNIELESINSNHLKSMLLTCLKSETFKDISSNHSEVVKTLKNLKYMFFSIFINVNNINELHIAVNKYDNQTDSKYLDTDFNSEIEIEIRINQRN